MVEAELGFFEMKIEGAFGDAVELEQAAFGEAVYVRLGVLSGVNGHALRFAYELACEGTVLAGSRLEIESVALVAYCPKCASTHTPDLQHILCPRCITPEQKILSGRELEVRALELAA